jgi:hypothetical protein
MQIDGNTEFQVTFNLFKALVDAVNDHHAHAALENWCQWAEQVGAKYQEGE